jgi:hypothetical protein
MLRIFILSVLFIGGAAMAKDGNVQAPRTNPNGPSKQDVFNQSDRGRELDQLFDLYMSGDGDKFDQAYNAYRQKYGVTAPMGQFSPSPVIPHIDAPGF